MGTTGLLHPGTRLVIYGEKPLAVEAPRRNEQIRKLSYRVRKGESLSLIASKFNVTVQNIR